MRNITLLIGLFLFYNSNSCSQSSDSKQIAKESSDLKKKARSPGNSKSINLDLIDSSLNFKLHYNIFEVLRKYHLEFKSVQKKEKHKTGYFKGKSLEQLFLDKDNAIISENNNILLFGNPYSLLLLNKVNKSGFKVDGIKFGSHLKNQSLIKSFHFKDLYLLQVRELYDTYYDRDLFFVFDKSMNKIGSIGILKYAYIADGSFQSFGDNNFQYNDKRDELSIDIHLIVIDQSAAKRNTIKRKIIINQKDVKFDVEDGLLKEEVGNRMKIITNTEDNLIIRHL